MWRSGSALVNPGSSFNDGIVKDLQAGAATLGQPIEILSAASEPEIDAAFAWLMQRPGAALLTSPDGFFFNRRSQIVTLAARHAIPVLYPSREWAGAGGLISYGPDLEHTCETVGLYTGRILKGDPGNLPVVQPTKFELVINLGTAKALGVAIPNALVG